MCSSIWRYVSNLADFGGTKVGLILGNYGKVLNVCPFGNKLQCVHKIWNCASWEWRNNNTCTMSIHDDGIESGKKADNLCADWRNKISTWVLVCICIFSSTSSKKWVYLYCNRVAKCFKWCFSWDAIFSRYLLLRIWAFFSLWELNVRLILYSNSWYRAAYKTII